MRSWTPPAVYHPITKNVIVWRGPSELTGAPILVVATASNGNPKIGPMLQLWSSATEAGEGGCTGWPLTVGETARELHGLDGGQGAGDARYETSQLREGDDTGIVMTRIPFCCADCSFVPDNFVRDPRPCPRCGGLVFRLGEVLLTVSAGRVKPSGPMTRQTVAGLTANDQRFLRSMRIGW